MALDICTNPGFEVDTTGWSPAPGGGNPTLTRVTTEQYAGVASLQVVTAGAGNNERTYFQATGLDLNAGDPITARARVKGAGGFVSVGASSLTAGAYDSFLDGVEKLMDGTWQAFEHTWTATLATSDEVRVEVGSFWRTQALTFYVDAVELLIPGGTAPRVLVTSTARRW